MHSAGTLGLVCLLSASPAMATGLYEASVIVTGMDMRSRPAGLTQALGQVLAKVSGNPALSDDGRLPTVDPVPLLASLAYLDRMSDQPKHDEQGSRDRPFDLVARFDAGRVDRLLRQWGEAPWPAPRPGVVVAVRITPRAGAPFPLRGDTDPDERHRAALLAAADRFGIGVTLPLSLGAVVLTPDAAVLSGTLEWSDADAGWVSAWTLAWRDQTHGWGQRGVSFDAAYRDALAGAARILSGHADPAR